MDPQISSKDWVCDQCGFELYHPVEVALDVTQVGLYSDGRFPGRAIVTLTQHEEDLDALNPDHLNRFWADVVRVGRAVKAITGCGRINYAVLGNAQPHLHAHVIPRFPDSEPLPTRPPWNDPRDPAEMSSKDLSSVREHLERLLRS